MNALRFGLALPQASEFSFVLFAAAVAAGALGVGNAALATLATAASMIATPILFAGAEAALPTEAPRHRQQYDTIDAAPTPVIIAGFGRFGQIIGRVLRMHGIEFTALERDPGPGGGGPPLRHQGLFRRSDAARRAARGRCGTGEAAGCHA